MLKNKNKSELMDMISELKEANREKDVDERRLHNRLTDLERQYDYLMKDKNDLLKEIEEIKNQRNVLRDALADQAALNFVARTNNLPSFIKNKAEMSDG